MMEFKEELSKKQARIEEYLSEQFLQESDYRKLTEAMRYSLLAGGKRLRPVLCMAFAEACGGSGEDVIPAAAAVEMIHTYSLIHDDLPCMDDDDFRRGKPTCHKVYGEDVATLAGDALLTAAFRYVLCADSSPERVLRCVSLLSEAAGENGMVAGQILDLEGEMKSLTEAQLRQVHRRKTGDLIRGACQMGAILGGGTERQIKAAGNYALAIGMAFQIRDDILDVVGTAQQLGKPIGSDVENGKSTFVSLFGAEACQTMVEQETARALEELAEGGFKETQFLRELALYLTARDH